MGVRKESQITHGDTANTSSIVLPNHLGTHIDAPNHFFENGSKLIDYSAEFWIFEKPLLAEVVCEDGYLVSSKDVSEVISSDIDILLIRTGYEKYRGSPRYWKQNPGMSPEFGTWLRNSYPNVRVIGMDIISVTSPYHRKEGREAHRSFLDPNGPNEPVLIVEDMALAHVQGIINHLIIAPLRVQELDSGPCTIIGQVMDNCM